MKHHPPKTKPPTFSLARSLMVATPCWSRCLPRLFESLHLTGFSKQKSPPPPSFHLMRRPVEMFSEALPKQQQQPNATDSLMGCNIDSESSLPIITHPITTHPITTHYITTHYITTHYITKHYITKHYITKHYITTQYITTHYI